MLFHQREKLLTIALMELAEIPVKELLPHDPPMVLLDRVTSYDESTLTAEVDISTESMFCGDDGVPGWVGVEYMAQAVAAQNLAQQEPQRVRQLVNMIIEHRTEPTVEGFQRPAFSSPVDP